MQDAADAAACVKLYEPALQGTQEAADVAPIKGLKEPSGQGVHDAAPAVSA